MINKIKPLGIAFLLFFQLTSLKCFSQEKLSGTFTLKGDLSTYQLPASKLMVTIRKPTGGYIFDSVAVINNRFEYRRELTEPMIMIFTVEGKAVTPPAGSQPANRTSGGRQSGRGGGLDYLSMYAFPSQNELKVVDGKIVNATILGGAAQVHKEYKKLYDEFAATLQRGNMLVSERKITERAKMTIIRDSMMNVADETLFKPFITANPSSLVSVWAMLEYSSRPVWQPRKNLDPELISGMLAKMPVVYRELPAMALLAQSLETAKKTMKGKQAMDFTLLDTAGKPVKLSDFIGKTVFLDFWASWCVPCRKENPNVLKLYAQYKSKGLVVLSVSLDNSDKRAAWLKAIADDKIGEFVHVSELNGFKSKPALLYDIKSIPTNFIIDRDGKFVARNIYGEQLAAKLSEIFDKNTKTK